MQFRGLILLLFFLLSGYLLSGCAGPGGESFLVPMEPGKSINRNPSFAFDLAVLTAKNAPNSGVHIFADRDEALVTTVRLIDGAKSTLDVRYPGWQNDEAGQFLLARLQLAAGRGIRVRLLLNATDAAPASVLLAAYDLQPNMHIRLLAAASEAYTPHLLHRQLSTDNSLSVADVAGLRLAALPTSVKGDVLVVGPVMTVMARCFFVDWNSDATTGIAVQPDDDLTAPGLSPTYAPYSAALKQSRIARVKRASELPFVWGDVQLQDVAAATRGCR